MKRKRKTKPKHRQNALQTQPPRRLTIRRDGKPTSRWDWTNLVLALAFIIACIILIFTL